MALFDQEHLVAAGKVLTAHVESQVAVAGDVDALNDELGVELAIAGEVQRCPFRIDRAREYVGRAVARELQRLGIEPPLVENHPVIRAGRVGIGREVEFRVAGDRHATERGVSRRGGRIDSIARIRLPCIDVVVAAGVVNNDSLTTEVRIAAHGDSSAGDNVNSRFEPDIDVGGRLDRGVNSRRERDIVFSRKTDLAIECRNRSVGRRGRRQILIGIGLRDRAGLERTIRIAGVVVLDHRRVVDPANGCHVPRVEDAISRNCDGVAPASIVDQLAIFGHPASIGIDYDGSIDHQRAIAGEIDSRTSIPVEGDHSRRDGHPFPAGDGAVLERLGGANAQDLNEPHLHVVADDHFDKLRIAGMGPADRGNVDGDGCRLQTIVIFDEGRRRRGGRRVRSANQEVHRGSSGRRVCGVAGLAVRGHQLPCVDHKPEQTEKHDRDDRRDNQDRPPANTSARISVLVALMEILHGLLPTRREKLG